MQNFENIIAELVFFINKLNIPVYNDRAILQLVFVTLIVYNLQGGASCHGAFKPSSIDK